MSEMPKTMLANSKKNIPVLLHALDLGRFKHRSFEHLWRSVYKCSLSHQASIMQLRSNGWFTNADCRNKHLYDVQVAGVGIRVRVCTVCTYYHMCCRLNLS